MSDAIDAGQVAPVESNEAQPAATPENVAAQPAETQAPADVKTEAVEKTFTQTELDEIVQKRIAKAEAIAARREAKAYREALERFAPAPQPEVKADNGRPTQADYANVDDYVEAMAEWKLGQREQAAQQYQQQQRAQTLASKTEGFYAEAQKIPGFDREAFDELPLTRPIAEALIDSESPAALMVHLSANPTEVERIAKLSPARQAAEIGKLETRIASAPKVSTAPAPIKPVGSRGSATNSDLSKASMDDYIAQRAKQGARWAQR